MILKKCIIFINAEGNEIVRHTETEFNQLNKLDKSFVGTNDYMGLAYFWDHEVKWWLREATAYQRVKVHKLFMINNVPFNKKDKGFITNNVALKICYDVFETNKQQKVA